MYVMRANTCSALSSISREKRKRGKSLKTLTLEINKVTGVMQLR